MSCEHGNHPDNCDKCHAIDTAWNSGFAAARDAARTQPATPEPCAGTNCGSTDGLTHSDECYAEHEAAVGGYKTPAQQGEPRILALEQALLAVLRTHSTDSAEGIEADKKAWCALDATPPAQPESALLLDGMTPAQFIGAELFEFQQATGCDTAAEFKAQPTPVVPATHKLVPIEPTLEMLIAGTEDWMEVRAYEDRANVIWAAMIAAAAQPDPLTTKE